MVCSFPFERIHLDFFHFNGNNFLLIVDAYSKFLEIYLMKKTDACQVKEKLNQFFTVYGLPETIVTDNGPPFSSFEFAKFCKSHGIKLMHSPPYHPQSNGMAERSVQIVKRVFRKFLLTTEKSLAKKGSSITSK